MIKVQSGFNPTIPLSHSRIGHQSYTRTGTVTASSEAVDFPADAPLNELTYEFWRPTALPATWTLDAGSSVAVNYFGIAAHTLGTSSNTVTIQSSPDNTTWTTIDSITPTDNSPIMFLFASVTAEYYRIEITGGAIPSVGVVYVGTVLEMLRPCYAGLTPISLSRDTVIRPNRSEGGQWLGRSVIRSGSSMSVNYTNLDNAWVRSAFRDFIDDAVTYPFFFAWRPDNYPEDVGYVWVGEDIKPSNSGTRDLMNVSIQMSGLSIE
jgi:hypothetical protein